jgi:BCD family chlorophyll transporter-like MFS transporter
MGLWGAAQAIAFGLGGFLGTAAIDLTRGLMATPVPAYALVFSGEALLFLISAVLAVRVTRPLRARRAGPVFPPEEEPLTDTRAP